MEQNDTNIEENESDEKLYEEPTANQKRTAIYLSETSYDGDTPCDIEEIGGNRHDTWTHYAIRMNSSSGIRSDSDGFDDDDDVNSNQN